MFGGIEMKKFKTESQKILDMMINSIYTHKEIFIREILSNASDAIDKLYYKSLTDGISGLAREDFAIEIKADKEARTLTVTDNGIGMTAEELDSNLGVIAKSGSQDFKNNNEQKEDINIIGQFGVGFYSAFMVSDKVEVISKAYGSDEANKWTSNGSAGYEIAPAEREGHGTTIIMHIRPDTEEEKYGKYLEEYEIRELVKKYSDYIRYPIKMETTHYKTEGEGDGAKETEYKEAETLNSMVPLWKKNKSEIKPEEYNSFYKDTFYDMEDPIAVIHTSAEGAVSYKALLFIPSHPQYNYYTKNFEKGLKLYTDGVLITDCCKDLLPDHFSFVKGLVDSELTLNVSRETIQQNYRLKKIASNIEKKIKDKLVDLLVNDREKYEKFYKGFATQLKYGIYDNWGAHKDTLKDLVLFHSIKEDKLVTLQEYSDKMGEGQKYIYYATGATIESIKALPQCEKVLDSGFDILCLTDDIDEFALRVLGTFNEKEFRSVASSDLGLDEAEAVVENKELTDFMKEKLGDKVAEVKISSRLKTHPVCFSTKGEVSMEMEKVLNKLPDAPAEGVKAQKVLEINGNHPIYDKLQKAFDEDKEKAAKLTEVLYNQALLIEGMTIESPTRLAELVCELI